MSKLVNTKTTIRKKTKTHFFISSVVIVGNHRQRNDSLLNLSFVYLKGLEFICLIYMYRQFKIFDQNFKKIFKPLKEILNLISPDEM